jgi:hypothetical protein
MDELMRELSAKEETTGAKATTAITAAESTAADLRGQDVIVSNHSSDAADQPPPTDSGEPLGDITGMSPVDTAAEKQTAAPVETDDLLSVRDYDDDDNDNDNASLSTLILSHLKPTPLAERPEYFKLCLPNPSVDRLDPLCWQARSLRALTPAERRLQRVAVLRASSRQHDLKARLQDELADLMADLKYGLTDARDGAEKTLKEGIATAKEALEAIRRIREEVVQPRLRDIIGKIRTTKVAEDVNTMPTPAAAANAGTESPTNIAGDGREVRQDNPVAAAEQAVAVIADNAALSAVSKGPPKQGAEVVPSTVDVPPPSASDLLPQVEGGHVMGAAPTTPTPTAMNQPVGGSNSRGDPQQATTISKDGGAAPGCLSDVMSQVKQEASRIAAAGGRIAAANPMSRLIAQPAPVEATTEDPLADFGLVGCEITFSIFITDEVKKKLGLQVRVLIVYPCLSFAHRNSLRSIIRCFLSEVPCDLYCIGILPP